MIDDLFITHCTPKLHAFNIEYQIHSDIVSIELHAKLSNAYLENYKMKFKSIQCC